MVKDTIRIGLLGLGTVGSGVARILPQKADSLAATIGARLKIERILVRDPRKPRPIEVPSELLTTDPAAVLDDPDIDIVVEVVGGERPALDFLWRAIENGKHVVTANKVVMARHGAELMALARQKGVDVLYEASVGGGLPIVAVLKHDLAANEIRWIKAIINGTTNYILTRMDRDGVEYAQALTEAQQLGYAEPDPADDVEGRDAAFKLAILASLAFRSRIPPEAVYHEGVTRLTVRDFRYARELGYAIKLLAIAKCANGIAEARVHPCLVPLHRMLAQVHGVFNAVEVEGDLVGRVLFYGQGAGALPTSSAIVADVLELARDIARGVPRECPELGLNHLEVRPIHEIQSRYYIRMEVADRPGVLAQIAGVFGQHYISIASVIQKEAHEEALTAELVIMTHRANEAAVRAALREIARLPVVREVGNCIRVDD